MEEQTTLLTLAGAVLLVAACGMLFSFVLWQRQQACRLRDEYYRKLFDHAGMIKLVVAADSGQLREANRAASAFFRRPPEALKRLALTELLGLDQATLALQSERARQAGTSRFHTAYRNAGSELELEIALCQIEGDGETLLQMVISDVTEQAHALRSLRDNEARLRAILDASADGIVMTDESGVIQLVNPAAEMMFGYLREEVAGRHLQLLIPAGFSAGQDAGLGSWIPEGATSGVVRDFAGKHKDGEEIPIRVSLSQLRLESRLHYVAMIQDLSELRRNERQLTYLEQRDVLTGLLNRREFERRLDAILSFSDQTDTEYVLCYMDVDQFKLVNDTCGHAAGDELLKQLAILVKSVLRESQIIARLGGDEFGVLLTDCTVERAEAICNGLLQTVRHFLFTWRDKSFDVAFSLGLAGFSPHAESASQILSQADVACHMAKRLGRDRLYVYHHGDSDLIRHHGDMHRVSEINQALDEGRFHLYAQPIVPVSGLRGGNTHYEILVRMVDKAGRLVNPDDFIPAAERYILMPAIDRWVIGHLLSLQAENLRRWAGRSHDDKGFLFGINLSGTSITDDGFLSYLKRQFKEFDVPFDSICFEITETAAVANLGKARHLIGELRALGCSFALDDFGTGLSSYSYLKDLPVDYLKIDGSFVRNMTEDPVDYAMVDSINQIAHILGLRTIAEWAENPSTLTQLRALNVDYAQGFGVGDMVSVEEFQLAEPPPGRESAGLQR